MLHDGQIVACDISEEYTQVARRYWTEAGVADQIDLRIAPARDTLDALLDDGQVDTFPTVFVDADKTPYPDYYKHCLKVVRPGGVIALDNVFLGERALNDASTTGDVQVL